MYYLLVLLGVVMVSYSGPLVKAALLAGANPVTVAFLRMVLSALLLLPVLCLPRRDGTRPVTQVRRMTRWQWLWSLAASGCLALHYLTWMTSLDSTSTFASVALVCTQPLFVAALSGLVLGEHMPRRSIPGAAVALIGALLIGADGFLSVTDDLLGDILALGGAALMAGHWLCSRYARRTAEALPYTLLVYVQTAALLAVIMPFAGGFRVTAQAMLPIAGLALGSTLLGHMMFTIALGKVSATVVSFALLGEPVGAMVWSMLMFGEFPDMVLYIGGGLVLLGLVLYTVGTLRNDRERDAAAARS